MATVSENSHVPPPADGSEGAGVNAATALAIEASMINQSISQVVSGLEDPLRARRLWLAPPCSSLPRRACSCARAGSLVSPQPLASP